MMKDLADKNITKMTNLGQMTRGILHDLNNSLGAIMGFASFLSEDLDPKSEQYVFAENIKKAGAQIESLVEQVRALSMERGTDKDSIINVIEVIHQIVENDKLQLKQNQHLIFSSDLENCFLTAPILSFRVMIRNLIKNAYQSLGTGAGTVMITISSHDRKNKKNEMEGYDFSTNLCPSNPLPKKGATQIDITDSGCGMNEETLNLAPSAHFTTKSADIAHGLGLTISSQIIDDWGGHLHIATSPNKGTRVRIILPTEKK
jgi:signal transduction histidine kinase